MRRYLFPIVVVALALAMVAGCDKVSDKHNPVTPGTGGGESGIPEALALAQNIPPMLANGVSQTEVYATVVDGKSRALKGVGVAFSTNHGTIDPYATTDDNGVAMAPCSRARRATTISPRRSTPPLRRTRRARWPLPRDRWSSSARSRSAPS